MGEMAHALRMLGRLPPNVLIQFPSGSWGFVGSVDARLAFIADDGSEPTEKQIENARSFGPRMAGVRTRTWETREAALLALADLDS